MRDARVAGLERRPGAVPGRAGRRRVDGGRHPSPVAEHLGGGSVRSLLFPPSLRGAVLPLPRVAHPPRRHPPDGLPARQLRIAHGGTRRRFGDSAGDRDPPAGRVAAASDRRGSPRLRRGGRPRGPAPPAGGSVPHQPLGGRGCRDRRPRRPSVASAEPVHVPGLGLREGGRPDPGRARGAPHPGGTPAPSSHAGGDHRRLVVDRRPGRGVLTHRGPCHGGHRPALCRLLLHTQEAEPRQDARPVRRDRGLRRGRPGLPAVGDAGPGDPGPTPRGGHRPVARVVHARTGQRKGALRGQLQAGARPTATPWSTSCRRSSRSPSWGRARTPGRWSSGTRSST